MSTAAASSAAQGAPSRALSSTVVGSANTPGAIWRVAEARPEPSPVASPISSPPTSGSISAVASVTRTGTNQSKSAVPWSPPELAPRRTDQWPPSASVGSQTSSSPSSAAPGGPSSRTQPSMAVPSGSSACRAQRISTPGSATASQSETIPGATSTSSMVSVMVAVVASSPSVAVTWTSQLPALQASVSQRRRPVPSPWSSKEAPPGRPWASSATRSASASAVVTGRSTSESSRQVPPSACSSGGALPTISGPEVALALRPPASRASTRQVSARPRSAVSRSSGLGRSATSAPSICQVTSTSVRSSSGSTRPTGWQRKAVSVSPSLGSMVADSMVGGDGEAPGGGSGSASGQPASSRASRLGAHRRGPAEAGCARTAGRGGWRKDFLGVARGAAPHKGSLPGPRARLAPGGARDPSMKNLLLGGRRPPDLDPWRRARPRPLASGPGAP